MSDLIHKGHRQRMRRKFSDNGPRVFDTYELLEMLLYNTVAGKDTNPHSKLLLAHFGSLEGVLGASGEELKAVKGIGDKSAALIEAVGDALAISYEDSSDVYPTDDYDGLGAKLVDYFDGKARSIIMLSLDNSMRLISLDDVYYAIDYSSGAVHPAVFMDTAVRRRASVVIVAHNHPRGPICPTEGDLATNILVSTGLSSIGITLVEHYVVSGDKYFGFMNEKIDGVFRQKPSSAVEKFLKSKRRATDGI